jgi:hypothetical protein
VADVQILLDLGLLGGRESAEIGIAEAALDGHGLDGLSAHRTGLGIGFHAGSSLAKVYSVHRAEANGVASFLSRADPRRQAGAEDIGI